MATIYVNTSWNDDITVYVRISDGTVTKDKPSDYDPELYTLSTSYKNLSTAIQNAVDGNTIYILGSAYTFTDTDVSNNNSPILLNGKDLTIRNDQRIIASGKTLTISGSDTAGTRAGSILFDFGWQLQTKDNGNLTIKDTTVTVESRLLSNSSYSIYPWGVSATEGDSKASLLTLNNTSFTVRLADGKTREFLLIENDGDKRRVADVAAFVIKRNGEVHLENDSELHTDYLVQAAVNKFKVKDSTVSVLEGKGLASIKIGSGSTAAYYYRDGKDDVDANNDGVTDYYAWKKWGSDDKNKIYTTTLDIVKSNTRYFSLVGEEYVDSGSVSDYAPTNMFENIGNGGTELVRSTLNAGFVKNTKSLVLTDSSMTVGNAKDGTVDVLAGYLDNSGGTLTVTDSTFTATGSATNSGTITVKGASQASQFNAASLDNSSSVSVASFTNSEVSISGTVSNSGKSANSGGLTIKDSTFSVTGNVKNSGTMTVSATEGKNGTFSADYFENNKDFSASADGGSTLTISVNSLTSETNATSFTIDHATVSVAGLMKNSSTKSSATISNSTVTAGSFTNSKKGTNTQFISSTVKVNGIVSNTGTITVTGDNSHFTAVSVDNGTAGEFYYSGTGSGTDSSSLNIGSFTGTITVNADATLTDSNVSGGSFSVANGYNTLTLSGNNMLRSSISGNVQLSNGATVTGIYVTNGSVTAADGSKNVTFSGTNSFDAGATLTVGNGTLTNTGTLTLTLAGTADEAKVIYLSNISVANKIVNSGGTLSLEISNLDLTFGPGASSYQINGLTVDGGSVQVLSGGKIANDLKATVDEYGVITIEQTNVKYLFVNANKLNGDYVYNGRNYHLEENVNSFTEVQKAIHAANDGDIIVFYKPTSGSSSLDFLKQGTITVNTNVTFETNVAASDITAVKIDSLHINTGSTATFTNGLYSMEDYIDNSGTLEVFDYAKFNANMIGNGNGTVLVDTTSRIVSDAIEEGDIQIKLIGGEGNKINGLDPWIIRPISSIVDDPESDIVVPVPGGGEKTFLDVKKGDKLVRDNESGNYYIYRDGKYYSALGKDSDSCTEAAAPSDITVWDCTDQYRGLYLVSDVFDLRPATGIASITVGVDEYFRYTDGDEGGRYAWKTESDTPQIVYTETSDVSNGTPVYSPENPAVSTGSVSATTPYYWSNTIYVDDGFNSGTTSFKTEGNKTVKATFSSEGKETADPTADTGVYAFNSFVTAFNSKYTYNHRIGQEHEGVVIRLREGTYNEKDSQLETTRNNNLIVEPDKTNGNTYDRVSLSLGGLKANSIARLLEFFHLESMTIGGDAIYTTHDQTKNWYVGSQPITENGTDRKETGIISFVDIGTLTLNGTLKAEGGATIRIVNCADVISNKHFSVVGGTIIIDRSNFTIKGSHSDISPYTTNGALSTENNGSGAGNVIVRNSQFVIEGTSTATDTGLYVNLKANAEFMITGTCTVNAVFTNAKESGADSKTTIAFNNATLDENTKILAGASNQGSAALKFEGYNTLDGTYIAQAGSRNMTVEAGATVNMDNGASISISGGTVNVQNCGNISLDNNSSITAGSFDNTGSLTLTNGSTVNLGTGTFTNQTNGVLTVDLQGDGGIGITAGGITNHGLIQIDLSHTDYPPEAMTIDINGLNNSDGEVRVIGGGGEVKTKNDQMYIQLNVPQTQTLYVNGEWDPDFNENQAGWPKGKNVGSHMYYGFNSFKDNPGATGDYRSMTFAGDTDKVVYVGGNGAAYGDLSIPGNIVRTITVNDVTYTRCTEKDSGKDAEPYYAWRYINSGDEPPTVAYIYTKTLAVVKGTDGTQTYTKDGDSFAGGAKVDDFAYLSDLTLNTMASSMTTKLTFTFDGDLRHVTDGTVKSVKLSVVVKDGDNNIVEEQTISVPASTEEGLDPYTATIFSNKLDSQKSYTVVVSNGTATDTKTDRTPESLSSDRATAAMGALTVGATQTVTLSGTTMSLNNTGESGANKSITNSGTLNVGTGESAKLTLSVAKSKVTRDVKVRIIATNGAEEYQTISVPAETGSETGNSTVVVKSGSFIVGQPYTVEVTDMHQCSYEEGKLSVAVKVVPDNNDDKEDSRKVNIIVRNAQGVKYTYSQYQIMEGASSVDLVNPAPGSWTFAVDNVNFYVSYAQETGQLTLRTRMDKSITLTEDTIVRVQGTNTDFNCRFDYSYVVKKGTYSANKMIDDTVNTNFGTGYYYVEVEEAPVSESAEVDSISGSVVTAQDVTNDGTLTVASQKVFGVEDEEAKRKSAKLVLDVDKNNVARWITVKAGSTDYSMYVAANESKAVLASEDFTVGTSISGVTVFDSFTRSVTAEQDGQQIKLVIDGLVADPNNAATRKFTVKYGSSVVDLTGSSVTYKPDKTTATISGVSSMIEGHTYSVTVEDERTVSAEAQTLAEFTAANVTNNANATITVTDAEFTADDVTNNANATITVTNSKFIADEVDTSAENAFFTVGGKSTLNITSLDGEILTATTDTTLNASSITGKIDTTNNNARLGSITAQGNLTFTGANTLNSVTLNAAGKTVTVGNETGDSLTVGGESTLNIGSKSGNEVTGGLTGTITLANGASLSDSVIYGGGISIANEADVVTVSGTNILSAITNSGTLTVDAATSVTADSISGSGAIVLSTDSVPSVRTETDALVSVTSGDLSSVTLKVGEETVGTFKKGITIGDNSYTLVKAAQSIYLTKQTQDTLYVNSVYDGSFGTITDGFIVGYNAFANNSSLVFGNNTTQIVYSANPAEGNYGSLVLGTSAPNALTITTEKMRRHPSRSPARP